MDNNREQEEEEEEGGKVGVAEEGTTRGKTILQLMQTSSLQSDIGRGECSHSTVTWHLVGRGVGSSLASGRKRCW